MEFIITIDTEADNQWIERNDKITVENLKFIPRFQLLCEKYHFIPTYLCTYEIVESKDFDCTILEYHKQGKAEIGAHLHPWTNPPFENINEMEKHLFPTELSKDLYRKKLKNLSNLIEKKTGKKPTSYRAGRWGFNSDHIPILLEFEFIVDCSVTPLLDWSSQVGLNKHGENFNYAPCEPYYLNLNDVCKKGDLKLIEVPPTIIFTNNLMNKSKILQTFYFKHRNSIITNAINKIFHIHPQWLRPYPGTDEKNLINICKVAMKRNFQYVQLTFHSSELMPKGSPYSPTEESVEICYKKVENAFKYLSSCNCKGSNLTDFSLRARK